MKFANAFSIDPSLWELVLSDLSELHPSLRQVGAPGAMALKGLMPGGEAIEWMTQDVVDFLTEVDRIRAETHTHDWSKPELTRQFRPRHAASRRAADWLQSDGQVVPAFYLRPQLRSGLTRQLGQVICDVLQVAVERLQRRMTQLTEWLTQGELDPYKQVRLANGQRRMALLLEQISLTQVELEYQFLPRDTPSVAEVMRLMPPRWNNFDLANLLTRILGDGSRVSFTGALNEEMLSVLADGFIFQRWCCLQISRALETYGYRLLANREEMIKILLTQGTLQFSKGADVILVHIEPRINRTTDISGGLVINPECFNDRVLLTPDVVIQRELQNRGGSILVLDPTLSIKDEATLRAKTKKYFSSICLNSRWLGYSVLKPCLHSFAMLPELKQTHGFFDPFANTGWLACTPKNPNQELLFSFITAH